MAWCKASTWSVTAKVPSTAKLVRPWTSATRRWVFFGIASPDDGAELEKVKHCTNMLVNFIIAGLVGYGNNWSTLRVYLNWGAQGRGWRKDSSLDQLRLRPPIEIYPYAPGSDDQFFKKEDTWSKLQVSSLAVHLCLFSRFTMAPINERHSMRDEHARSDLKTEFLSIRQAYSPQQKLGF